MTDMVARAILSADADGFVGTVEAAANAVDDVGESATRAGASSRAAATGIEALAQAERNVAAGATQAVGAARQLENAQNSLNRSSNATRAGFQQLGFQLSDVTAQMSTGTSIAVIFAQQSGQVVQALQLMGGGADGAKTKFGQFIGFLGGPWGIAISVAVSVIGMLVSSLGDAEDASKELELASNGLAEAQSVLGQAFDLVTGKLKSQNEMIWANIGLLEAKARAEALAAKSEFEAGKRAAGTVEIGGTPFRERGPAPTRGIIYNTNAKQILLDMESGRITPWEAGRRARTLDYSNSDVSQADMAGYIANYTEYGERTKDADALLETLETKELNGRFRRDAPDRRNTKRKPRKPTQSSDTEKEMGYFGSPLAAGSYTITSRVGKRNTGIKGASTNHQGVDMAAALGTPVYATQDGMVEVAGTRGGYGEAVFIDHGAGTQTRYAHMSKLNVQQGQGVKKGDVIGYVGSTGVSSGNHLHYEMRQNGKVVKNPLNTNAPVDSLGNADKVAEAEEERMKKLREFGKQAADAIGGINNRYKEQPRLIAEAAKVTSELDGIIAELAEKRPPGFEAMIADAKKLKTELPSIILDAPFRELREESEYNRQQQTLILQGRYAEAEAMDIIRSLESDVGTLSAERRGEIVAMVEGEEKINDLLAKREAILGIYLDSISQLRGALDQLFSGGSIKEFLKQGQDGLKDLRSRLLVENLFGDPLRELEKKVTKKTGLDGEIEQFKFETLRVTNGTAELAGKIEDGGDLIYKAMIKVAETLSDPARAKFAEEFYRKRFNDTFNDAMPKFDAAQRGKFAGIIWDPAIVVQGLKDKAEAEAAANPKKPTITSMSPAEMAQEMAKAVTVPMLAELDRVFGISFFSKLEGAFTGALAGYYRAGPVGGVLGAGQGIAGYLRDSGILGHEGKHTADGIASIFGEALNGAELGGQIAGLGKILGLKTSTTGGQIGGAIGSAIPIPGGEIIGSVIGSLVGGLFKKTKYGTSVLWGDGVTPGLAGNNDKAKQAASGLGGSVMEGLANIAEAFGGTVGSFRTSIGVYKDNFRVSTNGYTGKLGGKNWESKGITDFGDDAEAAIRAAIADAISDGAIEGLSAAVQRALKSDTDIDKAIEEALGVQKVEDIIGGLAASMTRQFREFERQAAERVRIAREYGFDVLEIEAYNAEQRAKIVEDILADRVGSLQSFLDDMRIGDLSEGSADEKRAALLSEIARVQAEARDGKDGAAAELANLSRELVQLSRSAYGTAGTEYAADRTQAMTAAEEIIRIENERIAAAQQAQIDTATAVQQGNVLLDENNNLLAQLGTDMAAIRAALTLTPYAAFRAGDVSALSRMSSL